jgi:uncharacterized membrane protein
MISCLLLAAFFVFAGTWHFVSPKTYLAIMPPYLPWHLPLVYLSGLAEILGGIGVLVPRLRKLAGWGLIALLIAVFPANIQMLLTGFNGIPQWVLIARLPLQFAMIAWVWWSCLRDRGSHLQ